MAQFNKRHYEAIAATFQECRKPYSNPSPAVDEIVLAFAAMFERDNDRFDGARFMHACKPGNNVQARTAHPKTA